MDEFNTMKKVQKFILYSVIFETVPNFENVIKFQYGLALFE